MLSDPARWGGEDGVFDPATVIGLCNADVVVVFGNPALIPWLKEVPNDGIYEARRPAEAESLVKQHSHSFTRVVLGRETPFSHDHILRAGALLDATGVMVYFPKTEGEAFQFREAFEFYYPTSRLWESDTTFGRVIMSMPSGASWRFYEV